MILEALKLPNFIHPDGEDYNKIILFTSTKLSKIRPNQFYHKISKNKHE